MSSPWSYPALTCVRCQITPVSSFNDLCCSACTDAERWSYQDYSHSSAYGTFSGSYAPHSQPYQSFKQDCSSTTPQVDQQHFDADDSYENVHYSDDYHADDFYADISHKNDYHANDYDADNSHANDYHTQTRAFSCRRVRKNNHYRVKKRVCFAHSPKDITLDRNRAHGLKAASRRLARLPCSHCAMKGLPGARNHFREECMLLSYEKRCSAREARIAADASEKIRKQLAQSATAPVVDVEMTTSLPTFNFTQCAPAAVSSALSMAPAVSISGAPSFTSASPFRNFGASTAAAGMQQSQSMPASSFGSVKKEPASPLPGWSSASLSTSVPRPAAETRQNASVPRPGAMSTTSLYPGSGISDALSRDSLMADVPMSMPINSMTDHKPTVTVHKRTEENIFTKLSAEHLIGIAEKICVAQCEAEWRKRKGRPLTPAPSPEEWSASRAKSKEPETTYPFLPNDWEIVDAIKAITGGASLSIASLDDIERWLDAHAYINRAEECAFEDLDNLIIRFTLMWILEHHSSEA